MAHPEPVKSIEQVVRELGRYPLSAFVFVQECVGAAADAVHGPLTQDQARIAEWMGRHKIDPHELHEMFAAANPGRRLPGHIAAALRRMGGSEKMNRHVSGQQLCAVIRDIALARWGLMARNVLARWSIHCTEDIGCIIFALVESDWLQKQPADTFEDFIDVFAFDEAFEEAYHIQAGTPKASG